MNLESVLLVQQLSPRKTASILQKGVFLHPCAKCFPAAEPAALPAQSCPYCLALWKVMGFGLHFSKVNFSHIQSFHLMI